VHRLQCGAGVTRYASRSESNALVRVPDMRTISTRAARREGAPQAGTIKRGMTQAGETMGVRSGVGQALSRRTGPGGGPGVVENGRMVRERTGSTSSIGPFRARPDC